MPRVRGVAVCRHGGHQLHAEPGAERLQRARLETRTAGVAHLSANPVPVAAVFSAPAAAGARLSPAVRRALSRVAAETAYYAVRCGQAVADLAAAV